MKDAENRVCKKWSWSE